MSYVLSMQLNSRQRLGQDGPNPYLSLARRAFQPWVRCCGRERKLRYFGVDVHLEFCEIAVCEDGRVSQVGRIASTPEAIREFAAGLGSEDESCWTRAAA
jgi:hypothetical protein